MGGTRARTGGTANQGHHTPDDQPPEEEHKYGPEQPPARTTHHPRPHHPPAPALPSRSASPEKGHPYQEDKGHPADNQGYLGILTHRLPSFIALSASDIPSSIR